MAAERDSPSLQRLIEVLSSQDRSIADVVVSGVNPEMMDYLRAAGYTVEKRRWDVEYLFKLAKTLSELSSEERDAVAACLHPDYAKEVVAVATIHYQNQRRVDPSMTRIMHYGTIAEVVRDTTPFTFDRPYSSLTCPEFIGNETCRTHYDMHQTKMCKWFWAVFPNKYYHIRFLWRGMRARYAYRYMTVIVLRKTLDGNLGARIAQFNVTFPTDAYTYSKITIVYRNFDERDAVQCVLDADAS